MENIDSKKNFIELIERYRNLVFSICLKMTGDYFAAEDLAQETFISVYKHMDDFDGTDEKSWICRIASNKCIDYHRATARRMIPTAEEEIPEETGRNEDELFQTVMNKQLMEELKHCCEELPLRYRETAQMYFIEGLSAKQISERTGIGLHTVQTRIYRAREKLKRTYRKEMLEK